MKINGETAIKFLAGAEEIRKEVQTLIRIHKSDKSICIAVAFWGSGAQDILAHEKAFRVICNLRGGGTNPAVIRELGKKSNVEVRHLDNLHAKVVLADSGAIVSSSNFSTNGLGIEGNAANALREAGIFIAEGHNDAVNLIARWFDDLWQTATHVSDTDLDRASRLWSARKALSEPDAGSSIDRPELGSKSTRYYTVDNPDKARDKRLSLYLRSAAAILALDGQSGKEMPLDPFKFLFGGKNGRAFQNHVNSTGYLEVKDNTVRVKKIGYFIGADGTMESSDRKNIPTRLVKEVARWMIEGGKKPEYLQGDEVNKSLPS